ncbi:MAG: multiubiquitin domain-containing protein [Gemmatimonadaceae bacterium]|nr:multiubiquitin domain-containing protein [Gemmatimonadaceae bacterium]
MPHSFNIKIDREHYKVEAEELTGAAIRATANPPIGGGHDLFLVVPGGTDRKVGDEEVIKLKDGMRFFSAPSQINPGRTDFVRRSSNASCR